MTKFFRWMTLWMLRLILGLDAIVLSLVILRQWLIPFVSRGIAGVRGQFLHGFGWGRDLTSVTRAQMDEYVSRMAWTSIEIIAILIALGFAAYALERRVSHSAGQQSTGHNQ